jgi:molybdopterin molybdotransferase
MTQQPPNMNLSVDEALERILQRVPVLEPVSVPLSQALGLILAEEVRSPADLPGWDNSAVDGFAVRSEDFATGEALLEVVGEAYAGRIPDRSVASGQALRITTGAPMPAGADAAVMVEDTCLEGGRIRARGRVSAGQNVRRAGEALREGQRVLLPGRVLDPAALGMAATVGRSTLRCHPRPQVAVLSTGDELVEPGLPLRPGQIHDSNSYTLEALVRLAGGEPVRFGVLEDRLEVLKQALRRSAEETDLVLTSAGVSMGERDLVREALEALGGELDLWKVRMRPGKPLAFGSLGGVPMIGLPGNPVSSMIGFEVFVRPALRKMAGHPAESRRVLRARLAEAVDKPQALRVFARCRLAESADGSWRLHLTGPQGSGILMSMLEAQALAILPEGVARVEAEDEVEVRLLDHLEGWRLQVRP